FVQLFQSIFSNRNKSLKKINKLAGSIVILDEAQAIPEKYMALIGATLQKIGEYYGTRFVLMTATQPKLLEFGDLILKRNHEELGMKKELLIRHEEYFKDLDRTKFVPIFEEEKINTGKFLEIFMDKWEKDKSALIVVNTISRSIQVYQELKKHLGEQGIRVPVYYLSTNIIPRRRRQVIEEVGELLSLNKPVILVSTQTIEAGVDLDFDMAFRDFAPIDSLIQTAGRVNREGKKGKHLPVYIVEFEKDNHYVYELFDRQSTKILLKDREEILESEYGTLAEKYYDAALKRGDIDESMRIWEEGILKLQFDVLQEFKLIDNIGEVCDIFVEDGSERATDLANAYEALLKYEEEFYYDLSKIFDENIAKKYTGKLDAFERKALLKLISAKMRDYIIQARISKVRNNSPVPFNARGDASSSLYSSSLYWIPPGQLEQYYDKETGFISDNGDAFIY
ncbi:MAG TPA: CRISPR-associated helicase Cas3', partial [Clostridiales bacterium]|nr:CRISPR-associated helicase Cas3' [Clostridiales bacterium]